MIQFNKYALSLTLATLLTASPAATAFGQSAAKQHRITGLIVGFDKNSRTVKVRERDSHKLINVRVPVGQSVTVLTGMERAAAFEQLLPGMLIKLSAS